MGTAAQREAAKAAIEKVQMESVERLNSMEQETYPLAEGDQRRLIGQGGKQVRELEAQSGARISMTSAGEKPEVVIKGTKEQRARAWELAQQVGFAGLGCAGLRKEG